jgi:hypothetical protein
LRLYVDGWDPRYGSALDPAPVLDGAAGPEAESTAQVDPDVEVPTAAWRPLAAPADLRAPDLVLLVDGVRRIDAHLWVQEHDDVPQQPCLAVSYAAGVVRCDLRRGVAEVATARVARGLFTASADVTDLVTPAATYAVRRVATRDPGKLPYSILPHLRALEVDVSRQVRAETPPDALDLLVVDGPLEERGQLPRSLGYIKTHRRAYLPPPLAAVVAQLRPGQRTPFFGIGTKWRQYSWYLRLPTGQEGAAWSGVVRVECSADLPATEVTRLADLSTVTLPRFASTPHKDPRAPQNLVPVAGLERKLRSMLGDPKLLHRSLTMAAARERAAVAAGPS